MHAMQTTIATTVGSTPDSLAFAWDMFLKVPLITDWQALHIQSVSCQMRIYDVPIGSNVRMTKLWDNKFWRRAGSTKLGVRMEGDCTIEHVHVNGNLIISLPEEITERINIRRNLLYHWPFHIPLWRQFLAWIVFEVFTFCLWSFFSTSHSSEL